MNKKFDNHFADSVVFLFEETCISSFSTAQVVWDWLASSWLHHSHKASLLILGTRIWRSRCQRWGRQLHLAESFGRLVFPKTLWVFKKEKDIDLLRINTFPTWNVGPFLDIGNIILPSPALLKSSLSGRQAQRLGLCCPYVFLLCLTLSVLLWQLFLN